MSGSTSVGDTLSDAAVDVAPEPGRARFAPPSRRPFEGLGNAMTTAVEIVVVVLVGYAIGYKLASMAGGVVGLTVGAVASFVRLYYRVPRYESPLNRLKEQARDPSSDQG